MKQSSNFPTHISINNHIYPSANKITTGKELYDFVSEYEGVQNIHFLYKGNVIPKTDNIKIPELGYEFGEDLIFIERSEDITSIKLIVQYNSIEKRIYIENIHLSNLSTEYDVILVISRLLHTSPNNITNYSEKYSENNPNEKEVTISLKKGYSVYDIECINATRQTWKYSKKQYVIEDESTILDLKLCISTDLNYKSDEIHFYSDNYKNFDEKTTLNSTNDDVLCFIYKQKSTQKDKSAKMHNICMNNHTFLNLSFSEDLTFYQFAYLIEKKGQINKNSIILCGKTINSDARYKKISEIRPSDQNVAIDATTDGNQIKVRIITNQKESLFYDLSLPIYTTVFDLRKKIIEKENCNRYFGLVHRKRFLESNSYLLLYFIDNEHPIEITKILPNQEKICDIYYFHQQRQIIDKKNKKSKNIQYDFIQKNLLLPINMTCQDVKRIYFRMHPQSLSFSVNDKVYSDEDKMSSFDNNFFIICKKIPIECFCTIKNKPLSSFLMSPDSRVRSLLKKVSTKKFLNCYFNGKSLPFFDQLTATSSSQNYRISKVYHIKLYDIEHKVEYSNDIIKKCFKKRVHRTIKNIHKQMNFKSDIKLFSDFIELDMNENPFLCCPTINANTFFINSNESKKTINLVNPSNISIQLNSEQIKYQKPIDFIIGFFGVPENKVALKYDKFKVPLDFSIWSLPNNAEINIDYPKNEDEYSQKFIYENQFAVIPYQKDTTLLEMKKIIQKKFDIIDCSLNCITFKFGEKEIINYNDDNNANLKKLLSDYYVYPLSFITVCTPNENNLHQYSQVKIKTNDKDQSIYIFCKEDKIKDARWLLEEQEGVPVEAIYDAYSKKPLSDINCIPDNLIVKFRHYEVLYKDQSFSFEYNISIRKAEAYMMEKFNLAKTDSFEYRIVHRRDFDDRIFPAKKYDMKRFNQFIFIRYFKIIPIVFEKRLILINSILNENLTIRSFKKYIRNNINKPCNKIVLSSTPDKITLIDDDLTLGDVVLNNSPIYVFLSDSPSLPRYNEQYQCKQQAYQQQQQTYQDQFQQQIYQGQFQQQIYQDQFQQQTYQNQFQQQQIYQNQIQYQPELYQYQQASNEDFIIYESDINFDSYDSFTTRNYLFKLQSGETFAFEFPISTTVYTAKGKIAAFLREKNKTENHAIDSSSIVIKHLDRTLKKKEILDSLNLEEGEVLHVFVQSFIESLLMTSKALRFANEDLEKDDDDEDDEYEDEKE